MENMQEQLINEVKNQWRSLWHERYDDRVRAEGISSNAYPYLWVERGLVIFANRNFRQLNLREILSQHGVGNPDRHIPPDPSVGGWNKFIKTSIPRAKSNRTEQVRRELEQKKRKQQLKKGGRGWLHR